MISVLFIARVRLSACAIMEDSDDVIITPQHVTELEMLWELLDAEKVWNSVKLIFGKKDLDQLFVINMLFELI